MLSAGRICNLSPVNRTYNHENEKICPGSVTALRRRQLSTSQSEIHGAYCRGGLLNQSFPWGDEPADKTRANYGGSGIKTTTAVGSYPANGYGLFDMAGNVWEFLADEWRPYSDRPQTNPLSGQALLTDGRRSLVLEQDPEDVTTRRVIRGGSFGGAPLNLRVTYRDSHPPEGAREFVGFRCAASE